MRALRAAPRSGGCLSAATPRRRRHGGRVGSTRRARRRCTVAAAGFGRGRRSSRRRSRERIRVPQPLESGVHGRCRRRRLSVENVAMIGRGLNRFGTGFLFSLALSVAAFFFLLRLLFLGCKIERRIVLLLLLSAGLDATGGMAVLSGSGTGNGGIRAVEGVERRGTRTAFSAVGGGGGGVSRTAVVRCPDFFGLGLSQWPDDGHG